MSFDKGPFGVGGFIETSFSFTTKGAIIYNN